MKIVPASYQIMKPDVDNPNVYHDILKEITECGHVAYQSEQLVTDESAERFVRRLIRDGHESVLEHVSMRVKFTVDRGFSHELVRHRLASFTQSSTRFCNYSQDRFGNEITVIEPVFFRDIPDYKKDLLLLDHDTVASIPEGMEVTDHDKAYVNWRHTCSLAEAGYFKLLDLGLKPEEARTVLPNSLKTDVIMTTNLREMRHILDLRAAGSTGKPHPQMLEIMVPLLNELRLKLPALFEDIEPMEV